MVRMILGSGRRRVVHSVEQQDASTSSVSDGDSTDCGEKPEPVLDESSIESELEPWVDWLRRATHQAEESMSRYKIDDWI
eukprot:8893160-Karenia_brevis.AAC.1